jgi:hypothetical protein
MMHECVKRLCNDDGITITELERTLKFGNGTIHNWDKVNPSVGKVKLVAEHFKIGIDDLMSGKIPSRESREMSARFDSYTEDQKNLIRCYMSLIENGKAGQNE